MDKEIKFIGYYSHEIIEDEKRQYFLSAVNKMNYIKDSLNKIGYKVKMVSTSDTLGNEKIKGKEIRINNDFCIKTFNTFKASNKITKFIRKKSMNFKLLWFLLKNAKKNEPIIVYHIINTIIPILIAKLIKRFTIILELEEMYQDVGKLSFMQKLNEHLIVKCSDKYILATKSLEKNIKRNKPFIVCNGIYCLQKKFNDKFDDNRIHIVYSGIINKNKGAFRAAKLGLELNNKYHIHIIGFGKEEDINELKDYIKVNNSKSKCIVSYDGLYKGDDYIRFIQKCNIGLSLQKPDSKYNNTSFPSKILSYISNGLRVVTVRINAIEKSEIGKLMYYYDDDNIAEVIKTVDLNKDYNYKEVISSLNDNFLVNLNQLLK